MTPNQLCQCVRRELDKLEPLIKAVAHVKTASYMCDGLPVRESDEDEHDSQVKALHGVVKTARASLEEYLGAQIGRAARLRLVDSGTPASGTDDSLPYDPAGGDGLTRAKAAIGDAADETDRLVDRVGEGDESAVNESANVVHVHCKIADAALEDYCAAVIDNPQAEGRRLRARAIAAAAANIINPGSGAA
jgi:hypothetical protein